MFSLIYYLYQKSSFAKFLRYATSQKNIVNLLKFGVRFSWKHVVSISIGLNFCPINNLTFILGNNLGLRIKIWLQKGFSHIALWPIMQRKNRWKTAFSNEFFLKQNRQARHINQSKGLNLIGWSKKPKVLIRKGSLIASCSIVLLLFT